MYPYDTFHQYSSLEMEDVLGEQKEVFLAIWYGGSDKLTKREQTNKIIEFEKQIKSIHFKPIVAKRRKIGNLNSNILRGIMRASFIICDITPINGKNKPYIFNENVMYELGLASAWKMEEQVIILCKKGIKINKKDLPFDINRYQIDDIDDNYKGISMIIRQREKALKYGEGFIIRNIMSKLDKESFQLLRRQNGLMFTSQDKYADSGTIRHLLNLGIIRTVSFPSDKGKISYAYNLTRVGRIVLSELRIKIFPDVIIDMYCIRHFFGDKEAFNLQCKKFPKIYGKTWNYCFSLFNKFIPNVYNKIISNVIKEKKELKYNIFNKFLEEHSSEALNVCERIYKSNEKNAELFKFRD